MFPAGLEGTSSCHHGNGSAVTGQDLPSPSLAGGAIFPPLTTAAFIWPASPQQVFKTTWHILLCSCPPAGTATPWKQLYSPSLQPHPTPHGAAQKESEQDAELVLGRFSPFPLLVTSSKMGTGSPARPAPQGVCNQTTAEFIPCSQHQPGQPPPPAASCACSRQGTALAQPPCPETCDSSVPFILSETSSQAPRNLDVLGVGSGPNHCCCSE